MGFGPQFCFSFCDFFLFGGPKTLGILEIPFEEVFGIPKSLLRRCFGGSNTYSRGIWKTKVVHEGTKTLCLFGFFEVVVCFQSFFCRIHLTKSLENQIDGLFHE